MASFLDYFDAAARRICYVGSSVTAQRHGYRQVLQRLLNHGRQAGDEHAEVVASLGGVGSDASAFLLTGGYLPLGHPLPDVCFLEYSINDDIPYGQLLTAARIREHKRRIRANLEQIIRFFSEAGTVLIFLYMYKRTRKPELYWKRPGIPVPRQTVFYPDGLTRNNYVIETYENLCTAHGIPAISVGAHLSEVLGRGDINEQELLTDGTHLSVNGGEYVARYVYDSLRTIDFKHVEPVANVKRAYTIVRIEESMIEGRSSPRLLSTSMIRIPYIEIEANATVSVRICGVLRGMLLITGPRSGWIRIRGTDFCVERNTFDKYCHYERLACLSLEVPYQTGGMITVSSQPHLVDPRDCVAHYHATHSVQRDSPGDNPALRIIGERALSTGCDTISLIGFMVEDTTPDTLPP